jgi:prepilin-type N-terminal cleavage/methylation domain-containing protein
MTRLDAKHKINAGFSLVELMVALAIIGLLAVMSKMAMTKYKELTYDAVVKSNLRAVYQSILAMELDPDDPLRQINCFSRTPCAMQYADLGFSSVSIKIEIQLIQSGFTNSFGIPVFWSGDRILRGRSPHGTGQVYEIDIETGILTEASFQDWYSN